MKKLINGVYYEMTPEEVEAQEKEYARQDAENTLCEPTETERIAQLEEELAAFKMSYEKGVQEA